MRANWIFSLYRVGGGKSCDITRLAKKDFMMQTPGMGNPVTELFLVALGNELLCDVKVDKLTVIVVIVSILLLNLAINHFLINY